MKSAYLAIAALVMCLAFVPCINADSDAATGGTVSFYDGDAVFTKTVTDYSSVKIEKIDGLEKDGFYLKGWSLNPDGSGKLYKTGDKIDMSESDSKSLYAVWGEGIDFSEYIPWLFVAAGAIVALLGLRFHYVLIVIGGAVAAVGVLELLGVINLF